MKPLFTLFFTVVLTGTANHVIAQDLNKNVVGGAYPLEGKQGLCLSDSQRQHVKAEIMHGIEHLKLQNKLAFDGAQRPSAHPMFSWPLRNGNGIAYNDVYSARYYVDQKPAYPNQIVDFDCGTKTYDTSEGYNHMGSDFVTWPFPWQMVDRDGVEIIAAAPGQILAKGDGHFDRSCTNNNNPWNAVYIQHADGSVALYGHMKKNSLTSKKVGEMVKEGEFLGIVGSSGNSGAPHLHFEVYSEIELEGVGQDVLIDPFKGDCNTLNSDSWWKNQRPHTDPRINAVLTHSDMPVFPECPQPEITYESDNFDAKDMIYFGIYLRDQLPGSSINLKIIRPDATVLYDWNFALTDSYDVSWWMWYYSGVYNMNGEWKWQATYQGETVTHNFNVTGVLSVDDENFTATTIYPNPFKDIVSILSNSSIKKASVTDVMGKTISVVTTAKKSINEINLESLSNGIYFLTLEGNGHQKKTIKIIKE